MLQRHFVALLFCSHGHKDMKISETVHFCFRIKKVKENCWPEIAFYHFGFFKIKLHKGLWKGLNTAYDLVFWQKMPKSILFTCLAIKEIEI